MNLSYRRNLTPQLSLVMNVTDVFRSQKSVVVTDTATLKERTVGRYDGRIAYIGLSWRFGGPPHNREGREGREGGRAGHGRGSEGWHGAPPAGGPEA